jgi:hypothetical protein
MGDAEGQTIEDKAGPGVLGTRMEMHSTLTTSFPNILFYFASFLSFFKTSLLKFSVL